MELEVIFDEAKRITETLPSKLNILRNLDYIFWKKKLEIYKEFDKTFPNHDEANSPFGADEYKWLSNHYSEAQKYNIHLKIYEISEDFLNKILLSFLSRDYKNFAIIKKKYNDEFEKEKHYPKGVKKIKKIIFFRALDFLQDREFTSKLINFINSYKESYLNLLKNFSKNRITFKLYQDQIRSWVHIANQNFSWNWKIVNYNKLDPDMLEVINGVNNKKIIFYISTSFFNDKDFRTKIEKEILPKIQRRLGKKWQRGIENFEKWCKKSSTIRKFLEQVSNQKLCLII